MESENIADTKLPNPSPRALPFHVRGSRFTEGNEFSDPEFATGEGKKNELDAKSLWGKCKRRALTSVVERACYPVRKVTARAGGKQSGEGGEPEPDLLQQGSSQLQELARYRYRGLLGVDLLN